VRGCYRRCGARGTITVVVGWSRSGLVSFLFRSLSPSKVRSARYHAVCGSGGVHCGRGSGRFGRVSLCLRRVREVSADILVAGTDLVLRFANPEADDWEHFLGASLMSDVLA
jgi:hypothetical protein